MWCNQAVFRSKEDFKKYMDDKRKNESTNNNGNANGVNKGKVPVSKDFRIALSAMMSDDDFKSFNDKFLGN